MFLHFPFILFVFATNKIRNPSFQIQAHFLVVTCTLSHPLKSTTLQIGISRENKTYSCMRLQLFAQDRGSAGLRCCRRSEGRKAAKYNSLAGCVRFRAVAIETVGAFGDSAREFIDDFAERINYRSRDAGVKTCLYRRVTVAVQTGNSASISEGHACSPPTRVLTFRSIHTLAIS